MPLLQTGLAQAAAASGYQIARSLRFNSADSAYLSRTPASAGNRKTWTWSGWIKRSTLGVTARIFQARVGNTGDQAFVQFTSGDLINISGASGGYTLTTTQVFRDVSAFYHVLVAFDTTQATASNRIKLYVNGVQVTAFGTATYPTQNLDTTVNSTNPHSISGETGGNTEYFPGYMADVRLIDGQALDPTSFGETDSATGVWVPKTYSGTYGTNGFWLKFDDNSGVTATTLGKDSSGNGNNWTPNNFSVTAGAGNDSLVDTPTNYGTDTGVGGEVRGNYAVLNAAVNQTQFNLNTPASTSGTLSNGSLQALGQASNWNTWVSTIGVSSGKWYWEMTEDAEPNSFATIIGITNTAKVTTYTVSASSIAAGDVVGFALDMDAGTIGWYKNGVFQATLGTGITGEWFPVVALANANQVTCNFGQRPFAYTAPSGYKCLCTANLPTPAIGASAGTLASKYMNVTLWTGADATLNRSVTGVGFQPDFVWAKSRSNAYSHTLYDAVRGVGKGIFSNATDAEVTNDASGYISSFDSDGFTAAKGSANNNYYNQLNVTYVAWSWKANGAGVSNTAGSITSTVSANTTTGISIVTLNTGTITTSATVGHGLGAVPKMILTKTRGSAGNWAVYHSSLGNGSLAYLNLTNASSALAGAWNNTTPTSTVFTLGSSFSGAGTLVAYCFAEVAGFSRIGSYNGNGSTDGAFVYCGFRPRFIMIKQTNAIGNWIIWDTARSTFNQTQKYLVPNVFDAEGDLAAVAIDVLSNGFKCRTTDNDINGSGDTYIFAAFAEAPFNYARAR